MLNLNAILSCASACLPDNDATYTLLFNLFLVFTKFCVKRVLNGEPFCHFFVLAIQ